jgi:hypothetical protein
MSETHPYVLELSAVQFERLTVLLDAAIASIDLQAQSLGGRAESTELKEERKALRDIKKALFSQAPSGLR